MQGPNLWLITLDYTYPSENHQSQTDSTKYENEYCNDKPTKFNHLQQLVQLFASLKLVITRTHGL